MGVSDKKDLGYLGEDFQYKLIHTFMEEKEFFKDLNNIIDQNFFMGMLFYDYFVYKQICRLTLVVVPCRD